MIASDERFLKIQKNNPLTPENEIAFNKAANFERLVSAVGGAIVTYATTKAIDNGKNSWFKITMAVVGGALVLRGALGLGKKNKNIDLNNDQ